MKTLREITSTRWIARTWINQAPEWMIVAQLTVLMQRFRYQRPDVAFADVALGSTGQRGYLLR